MNIAPHGRSDEVNIGLVFSSFGMSEKEVNSLAQMGIRYDKRSRAAYLAEFSAPSVATKETLI